ncbi:MAG TPA: hypothetical protein VFZ59_26460 [Verrucomicrobiae bacterium]|nr:hypothetical protein [Verrucomicrobiae bacterium]
MKGPLELNLVVAWCWIFLGFLSGMLLGLFYHRDNWLGGYGSLKRRMYRLGHISFFGLGTVNLLFWLTMKDHAAIGSPVVVASWAFILGALTMPLCCVIMAHFPKLHAVFTVPVLSLLLAGGLTLAAVIRSEPSQADNKPTLHQQLSIANHP